MKLGIGHRMMAVLVAMMVFYIKPSAQILNSPTCRTSVTMLLSGGHPQMQVRYRSPQGKIIDITTVDLGLETVDGRFAQGFQSFTVRKSKVKDSYRMVTGKQLRIKSVANQGDYTLRCANGNTMLISVRAYDDGVAFRYSITGITDVTGERTFYRMVEGANRWLQDTNSGYEGFYPHSTTIMGAEGVAYPALFEPYTDVYTLITEAGVERCHSASSLIADFGYRVKYTDSVIPVSGTWSTPWRVMIIGSATDIVESTLVTDVSPACAIGNTSWIDPAPASWVYWSHNHGSKDYPTVISFIDLAVEMGWKYCLIDWEWEFMENGGTIEDAIRYARERGVKILLWYNSLTSWSGPGVPGLTRPLNTHEQREKEFTWLNELGVAGIKVDFFSPDGRDMVNYYIDILEDAAAHHLMVDFHGCTIPRGWQRTYPNMISMEAVYGAEWYNNAPTLTNAAAEHNAILPFTRNVVGPMDYTPCTFTDSQHPHITTYGHEMALPIIFESGIQHMADRPSGYQELPQHARTILSELPSVWDETRLLSGRPGNHAVVARRRGSTWFIGGINGTEEPMDITVDLLPLKIKHGTLTLVTDGAADRQLNTDCRRLAETKLNIRLRARGGFAAMIEK